MSNSQISEVSLAKDFYKKILAHEKRCSPSDFRSFFVPSDVTNCPRRTFYHTRGVVEDFPTSCFQRMHEKMVVKKWTEIFSAMRGVSVIDCDVQFSDCSYQMNGHIDVIIESDHKVYVVMIKSVDNAEFEKIKNNGGVRKHVIELMIHLWLTEKTKGLLLYESNATLECIVFDISPHKPIINAAKSKFRALIENQKKNDLPQRPYDTNDSKECSSCEFRIGCWEEEIKERII